MSEGVDMDGIGIGCYVGPAVPDGDSPQMVQFTMNKDGATEQLCYVYRSMTLETAEELLVQALKMIRARRRRLAGT